MDKFIQIITIFDGVEHLVNLDYVMRMYPLTGGENRGCCVMEMNDSTHLTCKEQYSTIVNRLLRYGMLHNDYTIDGGTKRDE